MIWHSIQELLGYIEYYAVSPPISIGDIVAYCEYTGNVAGAHTSDIPSIAEILGYVEYTSQSEYQRHNISNVTAYVEYVYEPANNRDNISDIVAYIEYTGNAATIGYTSDIPSVAEILGYVEYSWDGHAPQEPVVLMIYGPVAWMI